MKLVHSALAVAVFSNVVFAQAVLQETVDFPPVQPGPAAVHSGEGCFLLAEGSIMPGDVDWVQVRIPRRTTQTVVDVDFPAGSGASALLASVVGGNTGFNIADNNSTRDGLCGLGAASNPVGNLQDSVADLRGTPLNATINIAVTGASDTSFVGLHSQAFNYEIWMYVLPVPCLSDGDCNDSLACTDDFCDVASGDCFNDPQDSACDDAVFCNGAEVCSPNLGCQDSTPPDCDDGLNCTGDVCNQATDECVHVPQDALCDNGVFCDGAESCQTGVGCVSGTPVDCNDMVSCTTDVCDETSHDCVHTAVDESCDDGMYCNGQEFCDFDLDCMRGPNPCPDSLCRESDDLCVECLTDADCDDGAFCNGAESCSADGVCAPGSYPCGSDLCRETDDACVECLSDADCDDGQYCNGAETCSADGACAAGSYPCGSDLCRETDDACVECLADADCDDGQFCNGAESCAPDGFCDAGAYPCGSDLCRETDDACVECLSHTDCDDGVFCNGVETCTGDGFCAAGSYPCGSDFCREADAACVACLSDADCDDGQFCNGAESCMADGQCASGSYPCGSDFCREADDLCVACLSDSDCNDGAFCNGEESCLASGECAMGVSPCAANQSCNEDTDQCVSLGTFTLDVRPGVCPAKVSVNAHNMVPVAVVGDVALVDVTSVSLSRVDGVGGPLAPVSSSFNDASGPSEACVCPDVGPDGFDDLVLSFDVQQMVQSFELDKVAGGTVLELSVSGTMLDGTPFSASDCVTVQARPAGAGGTRARSTR